MKLFNGKVFNSRIKSANVGLKEMIFGYFLGPFGVLMMTTVISLYYMSYYDTLSLNANFVALLPLVSVIPMVLGNIIMGIIIGKTKDKNGKARPYILLAAPVLLVSGLLMFFVPNINAIGKMVYIAITFNLFQSIANPMYGSAHYLMVSLSTRNARQRSLVSVVANIPAVAANGFIGSILMPLVLGWINGENSSMNTSEKWGLVMTIFVVIAFVCCLVEYYFTRERITEEAIMLNLKEEKIATSKQFKAAAKEKYWWIIMVFYLFYQSSVIYRGGYVFSIYAQEYFSQVVVFGITMNASLVQSVLALVSGIPLALGMLIAWPIANKIGKRTFIIIGALFSIAGSVICGIAPSNFYVVLVGQTLLGIGNIPVSYCMMALFSDVLDHIEAKAGFRVDGISMSIYTAILTTVNGLAIAIFKLFHPSNVANSPITAFFFLWFGAIAGLVMVILILLLNVEKQIDNDHETIIERQKQKVLAEGGVWIEPQEKLRLEQEKVDLEAEEARINELRMRCEKKGLSFEEEERKYQAKKQEKLLKKQKKNK